MRVVMLSDTHNQHHRLSIPAGDVLIHAGDATMQGSWAELLNFFNWFKKQPHPHKIFVAGNHDKLFEKQPAEARDLVPDNVHYLENEGIEIEGFKIWGSPRVPDILPWAFHTERGEAIAAYWDQIPNDTDILVTHTPAASILDEEDGIGIGCDELLQALMRVKPLLHVFGHVHASAGAAWSDSICEGVGTHFVNAAALKRDYSTLNDIQMVDLKRRLEPGVV